MREHKYLKENKSLQSEVNKKQKFKNNLIKI